MSRDTAILTAIQIATAVVAIFLLVKCQQYFG